MLETIKTYIGENKVFAALVVGSLIGGAVVGYSARLHHKKVIGSVKAEVDKAVGQLNDLVVTKE